MTIKSHKTILNLFFCTLALITLSACTAGGGGDAKQPNFVEAPTYDPGTRDTATDYLPSIYEAPPNGGWDTTLTAIRGLDDSEYNEAGGSADRIGAAYAYARGTQFTGEGVIVSVIGRSIARDHDDLSGQLITGYGFKDVGITRVPDDDPNVATCVGGACRATVRLSFKTPTYIAGIIAGESGNGDNTEPTIQGIAYNAQIKPLNIYTSTLSFSALRVLAIQEASMVDFATCAGRAYPAIAACKPIAVMHNDWNVGGNVSYMGMDDQRYSVATELTANEADVFEAVRMVEKEALEKASETTVMVFAQGNDGQNSINGMVRLYTDTGLSERATNDDGSGKDVAWETINDDSNPATDDNINLGGSFRTLPTIAPGITGKILTVIALKNDNEIWKYSNGCGGAETYCLGAPGVAINSAIPGGGYEEFSSTGQAAAHVSGAVAVLKGAFPNLTPTQLVSIILNTADYIPLPVGEVAGSNTNAVYGHGALNLARATDPIGSMMTTLPDATALASDVTIDNSGITLPTSFGGALDGFTTGFIDDYKRAYIGNPARISRENAAFTLGDTIATWESPELQSIALDSNSKMQFTNYDENADAKDTLIFTHNLPNHTIAFSYNEESKTPDLMLANTGDELHFQKIRPIASDLMQVNSTHKLGKNLTIKNAITSGEFDTGNRFNEAMANLNYTGENRNLTIGAGTLKEYGQFLGASGTGAYQLSDATSSQVTHLAISQNLPRNSIIKLKYTNFKTEVDMRYNNFAKINDLTANEYQITFAKNKILSKHDSLNLELIQPFAVTDGKLQQNTVLGYNADGDYNNVTQNFRLAPTNRRQQIRMTWQNQLNPKTETKLFISMQYENHIDNLRDKEDSQILGGISTRF